MIAFCIWVTLKGGKKWFSPSRLPLPSPTPPSRPLTWIRHTMWSEMVTLSSAFQLWKWNALETFNRKSTPLCRWVPVHVGRTLDPTRQRLAHDFCLKRKPVLHRFQAECVPRWNVVSVHKARHALAMTGWFSTFHGPERKKNVRAMWRQARTDTARAAGFGNDVVGMAVGANDHCEAPSGWCPISDEKTDLRCPGLREASGLSVFQVGPRTRSEWSRLFMICTKWRVIFTHTSVQTAVLSFQHNNAMLTLFYLFIDLFFCGEQVERGLDRLV